jgi:hypothetical protein
VVVSAAQAGRRPGGLARRGAAPALGIAVISTFVATATNHYLAHRGSTAVVSATVHGFTVGYWWAAGAFWAGAVICGALIRGGTRLHHEAGQPEPVHQVVSGPI